MMDDAEFTKIKKELRTRFDIDDLLELSVDQLVDLHRKTFDETQTYGVSKYARCMNCEIPFNDDDIPDIIEHRKKTGHRHFNRYYGVDEVKA